LDYSEDPLNIRSEIALKMLMNAHSTAVMTKMGRVVGNTMSNVRAGNLKLIGRATYLTKVHVDDVIKKGGDKLGLEPDARAEVKYEDSNSVLFETITYLNSLSGRDQESPVPISIIRVIESLKQRRLVTCQEADEVFQASGLDNYLYQWL
jgi:N-acetylmuramic acid 6-phosphate etherase